MTRNKHWYLALILLILTLSLTACQKKQATPVEPKADADTILVPVKIQQNNAYQSQQKQLVTFLNREMIQKKGIYTNIQKSSTKKTVATGHEMLSESSGLWLEYLALNGSKKAFNTFYQQTKQTFDQNGRQFSYRYDPETDKHYNVNATLDDLRILRALVIYDAQNHTDRYRKEASQRFANLKQNCIVDGQLVDYYDIKQKKSNHSGALAYFDLKTLQYFEDEKTYQKQLKVLKGGYLGDVFPLYASSFDWQSNQYSNADLNTSEALETLLHLSEIGALKKTSRQWLIQQIKHQSLTNSYTINGVSVDNTQSAANYALAAMIFANVGDQAHYEQAMALIWPNQATTKDGKLAGGLTQAGTKKSYSFNNLTALLAAQQTAKP